MCQISLKAAGAGVWSWDLKSEVISGCSEFERLIGYKQCSFDSGSESWAKRAVPSDLEQLKLEIAKALEAGAPSFKIVYRTVVMGKPANWLEAKGCFRYDHLACPFKIEGLLTDVTEYKEAEEALRQSIRRFECASEVVNSVIYEWDTADDTVVRAGGLKELSGYALVESQPTLAWWTALIHPDDLEVFRNAIAKTEPGTRRVEAAYRIRHSSGHWVDVCDRAVLEWQDSRVTRVIGSTEDVTPRRILEQDLRAAKEAAEAASHAKSSFLANISHEIRTPLGAMIGFANLLAADERDQEERKKFIGIISRNGELLARLIDDILDLSKVEAGRLDVERKSTSLPDVIADVTGLLLPRAREKGISLSVVSETPVPDLIETDPVRLKQILFNLIGNSIKFTGDRGSVEVRVSAADVAGTPGQLRLDFAVSDTGIGLNSEQRERLFLPFSQATTAIAQTYGGTGLGLVLARRLARLLGGDVELMTSVPGEGSLFRASIVVRVIAYSAQGRDACSMAPSPADLPDLEDIHILLADDAVDNRMLIHQILHQAGATVDLAENGSQAIEAATHRNFDVILMDIQMPELSGLEATKHLRYIGYQGPVIALTAHALKEERDATLKAGCNAHLCKPVDRRELLEVVARFAKSQERWDRTGHASINNCLN